MIKQMSDVPRYFEPYVNDCFHNAYSAVLLHMGMNPNIILADYLSFMYDCKNRHIGVNYFYRPNTTVEFTEDELNTSLEFVYLPQTTLYSKAVAKKADIRYKDRVQINMFIEDNPDVAYQRLKEMLDNGIPVVAAVDLFYMKYHRAYGKEHGLHCVVFTGYNEEEGLFHLFDKYKLSSSDFDGILPIDEVNLGRTSDNPLPGGNETQKRPVRNLWMEISSDKDFKVTEEKLLNVIRESCLRMRGQKEVLGHKCGLEAIELFTKSLLEMKNEKIDDEKVYWFRVYLNGTLKNISRSRKRFAVFINEISSILPQQTVSDLCVSLNESSKHWDICSSIALKLGIRKSLDMIDDLVNQLDIIRELENSIAERLEDCL
ncbi:BtrH N-terminal domain-containing protein [Ruminiclostridium josui]|uniref:BtrH N-terminal domain-containing protein n=1 Tax=Ruminiclostridium josui TaxID=1499 RepID=UPI0004B0E444|nr:BtrH N-terminal domain-containing protein [Ruminiclostridium josui]